MRSFIEKLPTDVLIFATLLLGLAPFVPEPHLWEKLKMLVNGELTKAIDIFDLMMHSSPAILLISKLILKSKNQDQTPK